MTCSATLAHPLCPSATARRACATACLKVGSALSPSAICSEPEGESPTEFLQHLFFFANALKQLRCFRSSRPRGVAPDVSSDLRVDHRLGIEGGEEAGAGACAGADPLPFQIPQPALHVRRLDLGREFARVAEEAEDDSLLVPQQV